VISSCVLRGIRSDMKMMVDIWLERPLFAVILSFACAFHVLAQEQRQNPPPDSTTKKVQSSNVLSLYPSPVFTPPLSLTTGFEEFDGFLSRPPPMMGSEYGLGFLRLSLASPIPSLWDSQQKLSLAACWTDDLRRQQEYHTVQMILGAVQAGGTAYLAYRYLKKYGFR
jgi:hypothetical protein